ncbi:MAG: sensor histidine kinase [Acidimicrobiia bacterium]
MTIAMTVLTVIAFVVVDSVPLVESWLTWWMLAALFAVVESRSIHLLTSRGAHSLNPVEIPLVVALGVLAGPQVIAARVLASLVVVIMQRQSLLKASFNTAASGLGAAVAVVVATIFQSGGDLQTSWPSLLVGVVVGGMVNSLVVAAVLSVFDSGRRRSDVVAELGVAFFQVVAAAAVGLFVVLPLAIDHWTIVVTGGLTVGFHAAFVRYGRLRQRQAELESLYTLSNLLDLDADLERLASAILAFVADAMKASTVELMLHSDTTSMHRMWVDGEAIEAPVQSAVRQRHGLSAVLRSGPDRVIGSITVAGREAEVAFTDYDRRLLNAVASHAGASLARALVDQRLRTELAHNEQLVRSKDQLIAAVSHELRTPLSGILGFAEILAEEPSDISPDLGREFAGSIAREALDLSFIVEDLLTAARFDLGQLTIKPEHIDMADIVNAVLATSNPRQDITLTRETTPTGAYADPARTRQIVRNLVTNAMRYGGDHIVVRSYRSETGTILEVSDNGKGVDESDSERIFVEYQTAHPATTQPGSVGLGLPISRKLARMMGGDVTYRRSDGWTIFQVVLPVAAPDGGTEQASTLTRPIVVGNRTT